jgi:hypothetical protein
MTGLVDGVGALATLDPMKGGSEAKFRAEAMALNSVVMAPAGGVHEIS